jgi:hypothetical protein
MQVDLDRLERTYVRSTTLIEALSKHLKPLLSLDQLSQFASHSFGVRT